jgi:hypothetical protein
MHQTEDFMMAAKWLSMYSGWLQCPNAKKKAGPKVEISAMVATAFSASIMPISWIGIHQCGQELIWKSMKVVWIKSELY